LPHVLSLYLRISKNW